MTEFRLGWFCYILQKSEKKKRNQEDFVNSVLNRLVGENNPKISFIPEINRVSSNRLFTGDEEIPEFYREALPISDLGFQSQRIVDILKDLNRDETFDYKQAVFKIKSALLSQAQKATVVFGSEKIELLNHCQEDELYLATLLIFLVNLSNIPSKNSEELRQTQIINQHIFKYLENEILLTPYSHRKAIEESLKSKQQIFYFDLYKPEALNDNKNLVSSTLKVLIQDSISKMPIIQNGFIIQNETINERIAQFIESNFKDSNKLTLIAGFCKNEDEFHEVIDRHLPKEAINKIFKVKSFALSIKASYDYTASKMKNMVILTENVVNYLENRAFTTQDKIELTVGGSNNLENDEIIFYLLIDFTLSIKR